VLFVKPYTVRDVSVIPLIATTADENNESVETCKRYENARLARFQTKVGFVEIPVAPFPGETSVGTVGSATRGTFNVLVISIEGQ
jgi:hypothetical protein